MKPHGLVLSADELVLILRRRYTSAQLALLAPHLEAFGQISGSLQEFLERTDYQLAHSAKPPTELDPSQQKLIDNRFKSLVQNELRKRFDDDIHMVKNLDEIIDSGKSLKEIQVRVQAEITNLKSLKSSWNKT